MTYSDKDIHIITTLRSQNVPWAAIALAVKKKKSALRKWWSRYQLIKDLPPKPKIDKSLTAGRVGLQIKKTVEINPTMSVLDIRKELEVSLGQDRTIPSTSTIERYLYKNSMKMVKLLKRPLVSAKNMAKRLEFVKVDQIKEHITKNSTEFIKKLGETVAIASVSGDVSRRPDVFKMAEWLKTEMERLSIELVKEHWPGKQTLEGVELDLPPVLLARYGNDSKKKTVLVYGHYDVQPALKEDGWDYDPWVLTEVEGKLYGRGSTDDKAPVISWLWVIETHQKLGIEMPVNLLMCFEGMEESGSEGLDDLINAEAKGFFAPADCVCISDNYWLGCEKPCLTYGLRGVSYFTLEVTGVKKDLHSGVFGGTVHEPMTDLISLMSKLVTPDGKILVTGIMDDVAEVTEQENAMYATLDFSLKDIQNAVGSETNIHSTEKEALMARWRYPSLSLHGIEGAFYSPGAKTVIPAKVIGKFSIRSVPNQTPEKIKDLVSIYVKKEFAKLNSKNTIKIECGHGGKSWVADTNHWNFSCAAKAIEKVYGVKPDMTREGGSIPVTLTFQDALNKSVLLLPMGRADDGAHSTNEKIDKSNYIEGIKLLAQYLHEVGQI